MTRGIPRRKHFRDMIQKTGGIGIAIENNCAIEFVDGRFYRVISWKVYSRAYRVYKSGGEVSVEQIRQEKRFAPVESLRDPVHGFVQANDWEMGILAQPAFQRLRRIRKVEAQSTPQTPACVPEHWIQSSIHAGESRRFPRLQAEFSATHECSLDRRSEPQRALGKDSSADGPASSQGANIEIAAWHFDLSHRPYAPERFPGPAELSLSCAIPLNRDSA
jgi:hypothetical protein